MLSGQCSLLRMPSMIGARSITTLRAPSVAMLHSSKVDTEMLRSRIRLAVHALDSTLVAQRHRLSDGPSSRLRALPPST